MKTKLVLLALMAAAGVFASIAVAKPPNGHGNPHVRTGPTLSVTTGATTTTTQTTTTTSTGRKVLVCHKVGHGRYVLVRVSVHSALARGKHGDVAAVNGACPGPILGHHDGTTTGVTTTTATTQTTTTS